MEFILTGKKGAGKGIVALGMINDYLIKGRPVATNLNLFMEHLTPLYDKSSKVFRLPDQPSAEDMEMIGRGNLDKNGKPSPDESKNGLVVLDECGSWLNAREYRDKSRAPLFDWFLHSRKLGWDVVYIVQDLSVLDKQFRESFGEHVIYTVRLDRLPIPILGFFLRLFSFKLPKYHIGIVRYGLYPSSPVSERKIYLGRRFYKCYDTLQRFSKNNEYWGVSSVLSSWHIKGRFMSSWEMNKKYVFGALLSGIFIGIFTFWGIDYFGLLDEKSKVEEIDLTGVVLNGYLIQAGELTGHLSNGQIIKSREYGFDEKGIWVRVNDKNVRGKL